MLHEKAKKDRAEKVGLEKKSLFCWKADFDLAELKKYWSLDLKISFPKKN